MATGSTLLAHLSPRFTHQTENIAVEALGHILSSSGAARSGLDDVLRNGGVEVGGISSVVTQSAGDEGERPDLACYVGGAEKVLIEAKFWAGLTGNQPVTYLKRLPCDKPSALLFVAPEARFESLWAELQRRIEDEKDVPITLGETISGNGFRAASAGCERVMMMTSWADLLNHMESRGIDAGDRAAQNDIEQLRGLAVRENLETLLPMRKEQLGPELPRFVTHMNRLVDHATTRAAKCGWIKRQSAAPEATGYRRRISILPDPKRENFNYYQWIGVNFDLWRRFCETPLWVTFPGPGNWRVFREKLYARQLKQSDPIDFMDKEHAIPIYLQTGVEYEAVLDNVVKQIKRLSDMLKEGEDPA